MAETVLEAERRVAGGTRSARRLRRSGQLPAILYGHKQAEEPLAISREAFEGLLRGGARMVDLRIDGDQQKALIKDVQWDALGDTPLHVDFVRVSLDETVELSVPIRLRGTAAGAAEGGIVDQLLHEVLIQCLPDRIPESIRVDLAGLGLGATLHLKDVALPEGVAVVDDPEAPVVAVSLPTPEEEAETAPLEEEAPKAPEVIGREADEEAE